jgi:hypothetical protein
VFFVLPSAKSSQNESLDHLRKKEIAALIGSTSPIKSATVTSGVASFSKKNVRFYATMILSFIAFGLNISLAPGCKDRH